MKNLQSRRIAAIILCITMLISSTGIQALGEDAPCAHSSTETRT